MVPGGVGGIRQGLLNDSPVAIKTLHTRNSNDVVKAKKVSKRWLFEICLRKDYRCIGNGCQCGGNYSIRTYYPSVASTPHAYTFSLVYDWCQGGNIIQYIRSHPSESRPLLVRKFLLL